ncbi:hypothetical protein KAJ83_08865 [Marivibrio halodurans]|uniref:Pyruvate carboxyltransferase domain-containing protein n=1 Tax=Marivibrio halodurans TaxID=2039722 RepID=A0A8J7V3Y8_9PROT|nr:hypothetical protein [Marivibrio halodurans]MBP5857119.1 hypothetical protein [Marivibrio halodurans]
MTSIRLVDTTMRDGQQCLWATRMSTAMMLPRAEAMDRAGFEAVELYGAVQFDTAVRYLKEDPWERLRLIRERVERTPLQALIRSACVLGFEPQPDDLNELWVERLIANGIRRFVAFDGLHDLGNLKAAIRRARDLGVGTVGWLTFSDSPVHTDALYAEKAREFIEDCGAESVMIEDASGVLTPERARTLVPAIKAVIGDRPLGLHSHSLIGLPQRTYLAAAELGVETLYTCVPPVADGNAPPNVFTTVRNLRASGYQVDLDDEALRDVAAHFEACARRAGMAIGRPQDFDAPSILHQIPGGVLSNLQAQLDAIGKIDKLPEVLEECGRVRRELGWPIQVTPFAQLIGVQATLNVIGGGERYSKIPDEVKKYALGYYGALLSPVDPDVLDRIVANGPKAIAETPPAREPVVDRLRKAHPGVGDDELLLRHAFKGAEVDMMKANRPDYAAYSLLETPLVRLVRNLADRPGPLNVFVRKGSFEMRYAAPGSAAETEAGAKG